MEVPLYENSENWTQFVHASTKHYKSKTILDQFKLISTHPERLDL